MKQFLLPDLGEGLDEVEIVSWHTSAGDHVVADQPLLSVETAKAIVEIPSPHSGHITKCYGEPGDVVKVGDPLVDFDAEKHKDSATVVGEIQTVPDEVPQPVVMSAIKSVAAFRAAPAVRHRAHALGIDLATIAPSGTHGEITLQDLESSAAALGSAVNLRKLRGPRRSMARNMTRAGAQVVPATLHEDADVDHWGHGLNPTVCLARAIVAGCKLEPSLNGWLDSDLEQLQIHQQIDLGIAVNTDQGLFVPVLRDVGNRTDDDLQAGLQRLKADVDTRSIPPREMLGATITLSNFGTLGGAHAALVVVPPQVAILGAGCIKPQSVVVAGEIVAHRIMPLSLTFDHRVITGAEAARFLSAVKHALES